MSSLFIQVEQRLLMDTKTLRLARLLALDRCAVVGRLVALWLWCLDNAPGGALSSDIDADMLAEVMGFGAQMGTPAQLLDALFDVGVLFLDEARDPLDGQMCLADWHALVDEDDTRDEGEGSVGR